MSAVPFRIGLLLFPDITQLDLTGPYEVFTKLPGAEVRLVWKSRDPVRAGVACASCLTRHLPTVRNSTSSVFPAGLG